MAFSFLWPGEADALNMARMVRTAAHGVLSAPYRRVSFFVAAAL